MSKEQTGGPAFPIKGPVMSNDVDGISMRDYFAAKAMQALITSRHTDYENGWYDEERVADSSYKMADAMLKAREQ